MFIFFNLVLFCFSKEEPMKFAWLLVDSEYSVYIDMGLEKEFTESTKKNLQKDCNQYSGEKKERCDSSANAFLGTYLSDETDIDEKLSKIPSNTNFLYIYGQSAGLVYDFNNLKSKMTVFFISTSYDTYSKILTNSKNLTKEELLNRFNKTINSIFHKMVETSFDGSLASHIQLAASLSSKGKSKKNAVSTIIGSIGTKVPFLIISDFFVKFQGNIDSESLYMIDSEISSSSDNINSKYLLIKDSMHKSSIYSYTAESKLNCNQYTLANLPSSSNPYRINIIYGSTELTVEKERIYSSTKETYYIPYEYSEIIGIDTPATSISIDVRDKTLLSYSKLNITVSPLVFDLPESMLSKSTVTITASENWKDVENRPKIVLTLDKESYDCDLPNTELLDVEIQSKFVNDYSSPKKGLSTVLIVVIVIVCVVVVAVIIVVTVIVIKKKKSKLKDKSSDQVDDQKV